MDAVAEVRDKVLETGAEGVGAAGRFGSDSLDRARSVRDKLSSRIAERALRRRRDDAERDGKADEASTVRHVDSPVGLNQ